MIGEKTAYFEVGLIDELIEELGSLNFGRLIQVKQLGEFSQIHEKIGIKNKLPGNYMNHEVDHWFL